MTTAVGWMVSLLVPTTFATAWLYLFGFAPTDARLYIPIGVSVLVLAALWIQLSRVETHVDHMD